MKQQQGTPSENSSYKIVALLITLILWVIILGSKEATIVKMIPTNYLLPKDMVIVNGVPSEVAFRLTGPRLPLKRFSEIKDPMAVDLSLAQEGYTTVRIHPDSIDVPPGIRVTSVSPSTITPRLERVLSALVPIEIVLKGELPNHKRLVSAVVSPKVWEISGARGRVETIKRIKTAPIDLAEVHSSLTREVSLAIDESDLLKGKEAKVQLTLQIK